MAKALEGRPAESHEAKGASGRGLSLGCRLRGRKESASETWPVSSAAGGESRPALLRVIQDGKKALEPGRTARQRDGRDSSWCLAACRILLALLCRPDLRPRSSAILDARPRLAAGRDRLYWRPQAGCAALHC